MARETRLNIRVSDEELDQLKAVAASQDKTLADWVRNTLLTAAGIKEDRVTELARRVDALERLIRNNAA